MFPHEPGCAGVVHSYLRKLTQVLGLHPQLPASADFVVGGKPVNITSLTFLVRMCGRELNFGPQVRGVV